MFSLLETLRCARAIGFMRTHSRWGKSFTWLSRNTPPLGCRILRWSLASHAKVWFRKMTYHCLYRKERHALCEKWKLHYDCMLDHWKRRDSGASWEDTLALPLRTSGKEETWPCGPQSGAPGLSRALTVAPRRNWLLCQNGGSRRRSSKTRAKIGNFDLELPSVDFDSRSRKIWE